MVRRGLELAVQFQQRAIDEQQRAIDAQTEAIANLKDSIDALLEMLGLLRTRVTRLEIKPCSCPVNEAGDIRCHVCRQYVNVRCWNCRTLRGEGPCPGRPGGADMT